MPRPQLSPGTYGTIWVSDKGKPYKARARFCDQDGVTRTVARFGQTKDAAKQSLRVALAERVKSGRIDRETTVRKLSELWLADVASSDRAARTKEHYGYLVERYVVKRLGGLRVGETTTRAVDEALQDLAGQSRSAARSTRAVLNGMFGLAVRHGAIPINPVRETRPVAGRRSMARALTKPEAERLCDRFRSLPRALAPRPDDTDGIGLDLADLVDFMLMTGCRIGEALACRDGVNVDGAPLIDHAAGTWEINATVVRLKGVGLVVQERPKSDASRRILALPPSAVLMLEQRRAGDVRVGRVKVLSDRGVLTEQDGTGVAFPSPFAPALRDPSNLASDLRAVLDGIDRVDGEETGPFGWVRSHTFRKTVATRLSEAGWTANQIADHLGHAQPSMTQNVYIGRRVANPDAARILDR